MRGFVSSRVRKPVHSGASQPVSLPASPAARRQSLQIRQLLGRSGAQAKLTVGAVNDPAEAEADRVADQVLAMPQPAGRSAAIAGQSPAGVLQRRCAACEEQLQDRPMQLQRQPIEEEEELLQTKRNGDGGAARTADGGRSGGGQGHGGFSDAAGLVGRVTAGPGRPLPEAVRGYFEPRFGADFGGVRLHEGGDGAAAAKAVGARAFTLGHDIAFAAGAFRPDSREGRHLIAHELTHVLQQAGHGGPARLQRLSETEKAENLQSEAYRGNGRLQRAFDNEPPLGIGETNDGVRLVQEGLVADGFVMPISTGADGEMDGIFGSETHATIRAYQDKHRLAVDGRAGRETLGKLDQQALGGGGGGGGQPGELPPCDTEGTTASAFADPATHVVPLAFGIPGLTCQLKNKTQDDLDLARVRNVKLKAFPQDISRGWSNSKVFATGEFFAEATADLASGPSPAQDFEFGFIQVCRPFDFVRATYRELGASAGTGKDLDWNATFHIRHGKKDASGTIVRPPLPALDVETGKTFSVATPESFQQIMKLREEGTNPKAPVETVKAAKGKVPVLTFRDKPMQFYVDEHKKDGKDYGITAYSWLSFFFLAYVVKLPSGKIEPLKTLYWQLGDCHDNAISLVAVPGSKPTGFKVTHTPVRDCKTHHCDRGEPGFEKAGTTPPGKETCGAIVVNAQNDTPFKGPSDFNLTCSS